MLSQSQKKLRANSVTELRYLDTPNRQQLDVPFAIEEVKSRCSSSSTTDIERATPNRQFCLSPVLNKKLPTTSKYQAAFREKLERRASVMQKSDDKQKSKHAFQGGTCNPFRSVTPHSRQSTQALQKHKVGLLKKSEACKALNSRENKPKTVRNSQAKVVAQRPNPLYNRDRTVTAAVGHEKMQHKFSSRGVSISKKGGEKSFSRMITLRNYFSNMLKVPFRKWIKKLYNYEMILKFCYKRVVPIIERAYLRFRKVKKVKRALRGYMRRWKQKRDRRNGLLLAMLRGWRVRKALKQSELRNMAGQIQSEEGMRRKVQVLNFILEMHKRECPSEFEKKSVIAWEEKEEKSSPRKQERKINKEEDRARCFRSMQDQKSKAMRSEEVLSPVPENTPKPKFVKKINFFPRDKSQGPDQGQYRQNSKREETKRLRNVERGEGAKQKEVSTGRQKLKAKGWREAHVRFEASTKENRVKHSLNGARSESRKAKKTKEEEKVHGPKLTLGHIGTSSLTSPISPQSGFQRKQAGSKLSLISTPTGVKSAFIGRKIEKSLNRIKEEKAKVAQWKRSINSSLLDHTSSSLNKVQKPKAPTKQRRKTEVLKDGKESKILHRISDLFQVVKSKQKNKSEAQSQFQVRTRLTQNLMKELQQHLEKECQD